MARGTLQNEQENPKSEPESALFMKFVHSKQEV